MSKQQPDLRTTTEAEADYQAQQSRSTPVPPVIVTIPADLKCGIEILVRHQPWGDVEVDVRPAGTSQSWTPIGLAGGKYTVRAA